MADATVLLSALEKETGEAETARALAEEAVREAEALGDALLVARAEVRLGHAQIDLDRTAEALGPLRRALATAERHGDRVLEAHALSQLGWLHLRRGDRDETVKAFERMGAIADALGDARLRAKAQHNLGGIHADFDRDYAKALPYFHRAIELLAIAGDRASEAYSLDAAGEMESTLGDARAVPRHERALQLRREVGSLRGEAQTWTSLGSAHTRLGRPELAIEPLQRAAQLFVRIGDRTWEAYAYFRLARAEYGRARWTEAMAWAERALDITESLRGRIASDDGRAYYSASVRWYFDVYVASAARLHIATGDRAAFARAFGISEQARARSLVDMMSLVEADLPSAPAELVERLRALRREVRSLDRELQRILASGTGSPERSAELEAALSKALADHEAVMAKASALDPEGAALVAAPIVGLDEVQRSLIDARTVVLEYHLGAATGSWALAISTSSIAAYALDKESVIDAAARRLHGALAARNTDVAGESAEARKARIDAADREVELAARDVSNLVLAPAARALRGKERLLVVADGALHYVPFGVLPLPGAGAPVVSQLSVGTTPSMTVLSVVRRAKRRAPTLGITVLADPIFEADDPRLASARPTTTGTTAG
ncbi:CHAT domain-containing protein, partial [Myxococcota bacterium]|nr:CHAT domain-containing protein [Myxococcota bacterium]